jgi:hypothetical protein
MRVFFSWNPNEVQRALTPAGGYSRVKTFLSALLLASVFVAFLIAALVLGSILAVLLIILIAAALMVALFKAAIRR